MRTLIVCRSILGATREYARWLSDLTESDLATFSVTDEELEAYDAIVVLSGAYATRSLARFLERRWHVIRDKRVVAIEIGTLPESSTKSQKAYRSIPEHIRGEIRYFKIPGRFASTPGSGTENIGPIVSYVKQLSAQ